MFFSVNKNGLLKLPWEEKRARQEMVDNIKNIGYAMLIKTKFLFQKPSVGEEESINILEDIITSLRYITEQLYPRGNIHEHHSQGLVIKMWLFPLNPAEMENKTGIALENIDLVGVTRGMKQSKELRRKLFSKMNFRRKMSRVLTN